MINKICDFVLVFPLNLMEQHNSLKVPGQRNHYAQCEQFKSCNNIYVYYVNFFSYIHIHQDILTFKFSKLEISIGFFKKIPSAKAYYW